MKLQSNTTRATAGAVRFVRLVERLGQARTLRRYAACTWARNPAFPAQDDWLLGWLELASHCIHSRLWIGKIFSIFMLCRLRLALLRRLELLRMFLSYYSSAECSPCEFCHCWNLSVANGSKSVHPMGHPMSHSTQVGFSCPPTCAGNAWPLDGSIF